jgi:hypothetical protein
MNRTLIGSTILVIIAALFMNSCSELKSDLPSPVSSEPVVHQPAWTDQAAAGFHGNALVNAPSQFASCIRCHAANFTGGSSRVSCMGSKCHIDATGTPKSPQACNTCHGDFHAPANDITSWAPPRGVSGETAESSPGVGAHQDHLLAIEGRPVKCQECHTVPTAMTDPGHIVPNASHATVVFNDTLARLVSGSFTPQPVYDPVTHTCNSTYCHGAWQLKKSSTSSANQGFYTDSMMVGNSYAPVWNGGSAQDACGSCHDLPPKGHVNFNWTAKQCGLCHVGIVDANGDIADKTKHMNGLIDVYGEPPRPF